MDNEAAQARMRNWDVLPPPNWEWRFFGNEDWVIKARFSGINWWKRFWTRVFFGSRWRRL